jgi:hypothetical protein
LGWGQGADEVVVAVQSSIDRGEERCGGFAGLVFGLELSELLMVELVAFEVGAETVCAAGEMLKVEDYRGIDG